MMKKLLALILVLLLCLSLAACGDEDAFALYQKMQKTMNEVTSLEMTGTTTATITMMGQTVDMEMDITCKEVLHSATDVDMEMLMTIKTMGQTMPGSAYYRDGYMYQSTMGQEYKTKMGLDKAMSTANIMNIKITEEAVKDAEVKKLSGGDMEFSITVKEEYANQLLGDFVDAMMKEMGLEDVSMVFRNISYSAVVDKDGTPRSYRMIYGASVTMEGMTIDMDYDMSFDIVSLNSITEINFPAELDSYPEI